jgi:hypothetical protein
MEPREPRARRIEGNSDLTVAVPKQNGEKHIAHLRSKHKFFYYNSSKIISNSWRSPSSLPHLIIIIKIEFLPHFYYKIKLVTDKEAPSTLGFKQKAK